MSAEAILDELLRDGWAGLLAWQGVREEGLHLDFKVKRDCGKPELDPDDEAVLSRAMSGFANTEGGVIVLGVATERANDLDRAREVVPVQFLGKFAERIGARLATLTDPPIARLRLERLADPTQPDRGVVVLLIPESLGGPHRATTGAKAKDRYFMRTDDDTVPMPHALLADRFGRTTRPSLRLLVRWEGVAADTSSSIRLRVRNDGRGAARHPAVQIVTVGVPLRWEVSQSFGLTQWRRQESRINDMFAMLFQSTADVVVYPGLDIEFAHASVLHGSKLESPIHVSGYLHAVDAQPVPFSVSLEPGHSADLILP